jgi:hypothetical protein
MTSATRTPATSEILFLKRLLYLKASIDNESTLNTFSVPFEQEKRRDLASASNLMIDTNAVISGRGSAGLDSLQRDQINRGIEEQYYQAGEDNINTAAPRTSHGYRVRNSLKNGTFDLTQPVLNPNQNTNLGLNEYLEYDKGTDYKKV